MEPDDGVGAVLLIRSVACVLVAEEPLQQLLFTNVEPFAEPHNVVPLPLNTLDTSSVFDAFTEKPNCELAGEVSNPLGYVEVFVA